jgi:hypothetical protein
VVLKRSLVFIEIFVNLFGRKIFYYEILYMLTYHSSVYGLTVIFRKWKFFILSESFACRKINTIVTVNDLTLTKLCDKNRGFWFLCIYHLYHCGNLCNRYKFPGDYCFCPNYNSVLNTCVFIK